MHLPKGIGSHSPEEVSFELRPMWSTLAGERKSGRLAGSQALERCPGPWGRRGWGRWGWMGVSGDGVDAGRPRGGAPVWWVNAYSWARELRRHQIWKKNFFSHKWQHFPNLPDTKETLHKLSHPGRYRWEYRRGKASSESGEMVFLINCCRTHVFSKYFIKA